MDKELERILQRLHGEYTYDPLVTEEHKAWWFQMALSYLRSYLKFYARFQPETVETLYWERYWRGHERQVRNKPGELVTEIAGFPTVMGILNSMNKGELYDCLRDWEFQYAGRREKLKLVPLDEILIVWYEKTQYPFRIDPNVFKALKKLEECPHYGDTTYWVRWAGFITCFEAWDVEEKEKRRELVDRGVPFHLIKYVRSLFIRTRINKITGEEERYQFPYGN